MKLSSYDGTLHRAQRLAKVAKLACATIGITSDQSQLLIRSLHDHKGHLTVTWMFAPTDHQRNAFAVAWDLVGEHREAVAHEVLHDAT